MRPSLEIKILTMVGAILSKIDEVVEENKSTCRKGSRCRQSSVEVQFLTGLMSLQ